MQDVEERKLGLDTGTFETISRLLQLERLHLKPLQNVDEDANYLNIIILREVTLLALQKERNEVYTRYFKGICSYS